MALTARVLHRTVNGLGNSVPVRPEQSEAAQLRDELQVVCNSLAWFEELGDVYNAAHCRQRIAKLEAQIAALEMPAEDEEAFLAWESQARRDDARAEIAQARIDFKQGC